MSTGKIKWRIKGTRYIFGGNLGTPYAGKKIKNQNGEGRFDCIDDR